MSNVSVFPSHEALVEYVSESVAKFYAGAENCLTCFAAGDTPLPVFDRLVQMQHEQKADLSRSSFVSLDEWWGIGYETAGSCVQIMRDHLYTPAGISEDRLHLFNGLSDDPQKEMAQMEAFVRAHGGLDLLLLGIGMNGHVGFIEPGIHSSGFCEMVSLSETTKAVSAKYFGVETPQQYGITLGLKTLMSAKRILIMACGERKAEIVAKTINGPISDSCPSSLFRDMNNVEYCFDGAAAALL